VTCVKMVAPSAPIASPPLLKLLELPTSPRGRTNPSVLDFPPKVDFVPRLGLKLTQNPGNVGSARWKWLKKIDDLVFP
jgi:hypothetical protein